MGEILEQLREFFLSANAKWWWLEPLIAGLVVFGGIAVATALTRGRQRQAAMEDDVLTVALTLPIHLWFLNEKGMTEREGGLESREWHARQSFWQPMQRLRSNAYQVRRPRRRNLRAEVDDLMARVIAAEFRFDKGIPLSSRETLNISSRSVRREVLRDHAETLDEQVRAYEIDGFPDDPDDE